MSRVSLVINYQNIVNLQLTDFVLDISVKHIIPTMELKIRTLYQQVGYKHVYFAHTEMEYVPN